MNPQRTELEFAVKAVLTELGIHGKIIQRRKKGRSAPEKN